MLTDASSNYKQNKEKKTKRRTVPKNAERNLAMDTFEKKVKTLDSIELQHCVACHQLKISESIANQVSYATEKIFG